MTEILMIYYYLGGVLTGLFIILLAYLLTKN